MILLTLRLTDTDSRFAEDETHSAGILKFIALRIGEIDRGWILNFMCVGRVDNNISEEILICILLRLL